MPSNICLSQFSLRGDNLAQRQEKTKLLNFLTKKRKKLLRHATAPERRFKKFLTHYLKHNFEHTILIKPQKIITLSHNGCLKGFIIDIYLPEFKIAYEIDGFHHDKPEQHQKDALRDYLLLKKKGIKTFRIANQLTHDRDVVADFIAHSLNPKAETKRRRFKPIIKPISRIKEIQMQNDWIAQHGLTQCKPVN